MPSSVTYTNFAGQIVHENRGGTERAYLPDTLGSTAALLDSSQTKTDEWRYWPYGEVASRTGTHATPFTFVGTLGYFKDLLDKLIYVRARHYRPDHAQWLTVDPWWPLEAAYSYAMGDPLGNQDASGCGLCPCSFKGDVGKLYIDCNCVGYPIATIPEKGKVINPARCGSLTDADAIYIGRKLFKIDGSTCVDVSCSAGNVSLNYCVNLFACYVFKKPGLSPTRPGAFPGRELPFGEDPKRVRPRPVPFPALPPGPPFGGSGRPLPLP